MLDLFRVVQQDPFRLVMLSHLFPHHLLVRMTRVGALHHPSHLVMHHLFQLTHCLLEVRLTFLFFMYECKYSATICKKIFPVTMDKLPVYPDDNKPFIPSAPMGPLPGYPEIGFKDGKNVAKYWLMRH